MVDNYVLVVINASLALPVRAHVLRRANHRASVSESLVTMNSAGLAHVEVLHFNYDYFQHPAGFAVPLSRELQVINILQLGCAQDDALANRKQNKLSTRLDLSTRRLGTVLKCI